MTTIRDHVLAANLLRTGISRVALTRAYDELRKDPGCHEKKLNLKRAMDRLVKAMSATRKIMESTGE